MSFSTFYYGTEAPSISRRVVINLFFLTVALFIYGRWADFIPAKSWISLGRFIVFTMGLAATVFFIYSYSTGRASFRPGTSLLIKWLSYVILPPVFFYFIWVGVVHGLGSALTYLVGSPSSMNVIAWKESNPGRYSCDLHLKAVELSTAYPSYVCLSEAQYFRLPTKGELTLSGSKSPLGFSVSSWQVKSANSSLHTDAIQRR